MAHKIQASRYPTAWHGILKLGRMYPYAFAHG